MALPTPNDLQTFALNQSRPACRREEDHTQRTVFAGGRQRTDEGICQGEKDTDGQNQKTMHTPITEDEIDAAVKDLFENGELCPFCSSTRGDLELDQVDINKWTVNCTKCGCIGPDERIPALAVSTWNTRRIVPRAPARGAVMANAGKEMEKLLCGDITTAVKAIEALEGEGAV